MKRSDVLPTRPCHSALPTLIARPPTALVVEEHKLSTGSIPGIRLLSARPPYRLNSSRSLHTRITFGRRVHWRRVQIRMRKVFADCWREFPHIACFSSLTKALSSTVVTMK
jgi:hypothetical protein